MAEVQAIVTLRARGWSFRRIGRELGVHRETAARYVPLPEAARADDTGDGSAQERPNPPTGSVGKNQPNPPAGSRPHSLAEPCRAFILAALDPGLSSQRICQDLKAERASAGSYGSVNRFVRRLKTQVPLPFRRMECAPGDETQIDFGTGAPIVTADGKRRHTHVLRVVLSEPMPTVPTKLYTSPT